MNRLPVLAPEGTDEEMLDNLQRETFSYFLKETNPRNGLIKDKTQPKSPSSIGVIGMGLSVYVVGVERGLFSRKEAVARTLTILRFFHRSSQSKKADATGYKGFFYHFLDMRTGRRAWECELSTIDTAFLMAGMLTAAQYFTNDTDSEKEIRELADTLYRQVDWKWALNGRSTLTHGWKPETGFLSNRWDTGYSEALILYALALGSPSHSISKKGYTDWTSTFEWKKVYGIEYWYAGPLFIHQMSHLWIAFKDIKDGINRKFGIDYFENSRRATYVHRQYAIQNPLKFPHYGKNGWGFTASDGPGPAKIEVDGIPREFFNYIARGAPFGPDDGTIAPWAVTASLPFAPEIVVATIRHAIERLELKNHKHYGFDASFNAAFPKKGPNRHGWVSPWRFGLNEAPIVLMLENYRSGLIWGLVKKCPYISKGLRRAGFTGGWLERKSSHSKGKNENRSKR